MLAVRSSGINDVNEEGCKTNVVESDWSPGICHFVASWTFFKYSLSLGDWPQILGKNLSLQKIHLRQRNKLARSHVRIIYKPLQVMSWIFYSKDLTESISVIAWTGLSWTRLKTLNSLVVFFTIKKKKIKMRRKLLFTCKSLSPSSQGYTTSNHTWHQHVLQ